MLTSMRLGNFKAFGPTQEIPIKPITLIFGPNSGGKSSLIHGLLLAHHAITTQQNAGNLDVHRTDIGGDSVDLGGFRQYVHRHKVDQRVEWGVELENLVSANSPRVEDDLTASASGLLNSFFSVARHLGVTMTFGVQLNDSGEPVEGTVASIVSIDILADGESILRLSARPSSPGRMRVDRMEISHRVFEQRRAEIFEAIQAETDDDSANMDVLLRLTGEIIAHMSYQQGFPIPRGIDWSVTSYALYMTYRGPHSSEREISEGENEDYILLDGKPGELIAGLLNDLLLSANAMLLDDIERVQYLGPLRSYPARRLFAQEQYDHNWRAGGGHAWDVVRDKPEVREKVNAWLGDASRLKTPYELRVREYVPEDSVENVLVIALEVWNETEAPLLQQEVADGSVDEESDDESTELLPAAVNIPWMLESMQVGLTMPMVDRFRELVLIDMRSNTIVSHRDVGIGVSQVLPVLVSAYASQDAIVAIEQPEIHLHPALQTELADVFIESAFRKPDINFGLESNGFERNNTFILETHSEHLILRLMRRIRDTTNGTLPEGMPPLTPADVAILYVDPLDSSSPAGPTSIVRVIELDDEGGLLTPWPGGFFEEGFNERFS